MLVMMGRVSVRKSNAQQGEVEKYKTRLVELDDRQMKGPH